MKVADDFDAPFGDNYQPEEEGSDTFQPITVNLSAANVEFLHEIVSIYLSENVEVLDQNEFHQIDEIFALLKPGIVPFKPSNRA